MATRAMMAVAVGLAAAGAWGQCEQGWDDRFAPTGLRYPLSSVAVTEFEGRPAIFGGGEFDPYAPGAHDGGATAWDGQGWTDNPGGLEPYENDPYAAPLFVGDPDRGFVYMLSGYMKVGGEFVSPLARWDGRAWAALGGPLRARLLAPGPGAEPETVAVAARYGNEHMDAVWLRRDGDWGLIGVFDGWFDIRSMLWADLGAGAQLHVFGGFTQIDGQPIANGATWDGQTWRPFGGGVDGEVNAAVGFDIGTGPGVMLLTDDRWRFYDGHGWLAGALDGGPKSPRFLGRAALGAQDTLLFEDAWAPRGPWAWDGHAWSRLPGRFDGPVDAVCNADLGQGDMLYAFGRFTGIDGQSRLGGSAFDGRRWLPLDNAGPRTLSGVRALLAVGDEGGQAFAGRLFAAGGLHRGWKWEGAVAEWDGAAWRSLGLNWDGPAWTVRPPMLVADLGHGPRLIVGGEPGWTDEFQMLSVASWDGRVWQSLDPAGLFDAVEALAVFDDGEGPRLYGAGRGRFSDGTSRGMFRYMGDGWEPAVPPGVEVSYITTFDDGSGPGLYASLPGGFDFGDGVIGPVVRWTPGGWEQVGGDLYAGDGIAEAFYLTTVEFGGDRMLAAQGYFNFNDHSTGNTQIAFLDGDTWRADTDFLPHHAWEIKSFETDAGLVTLINQFSTPDDTDRIDIYENGAWSTLPGTFDNYIQTFALAEHDGRRSVFVAGGFDSVGGTPSYRFARYGCPSCAVDFDADGDADELDVVAFLDLWGAGNPAGDFNADGWIDTRDVVAFLNAWNAGCP